MATPTYSVFDGDGGANTPKRPVAATDLGGLNKKNVLGYEPDPDEQVTAEDVMQWERCIEAMGRMIPMLNADLYLQSGASVTINVTSVKTSLNTTNVVVTDVGPGHYRVTVPVNSLPATNGRPVTFLASASSANVAHTFALEVSSNEWDVYIQNTSHAYSGSAAGVKLMVY